MNPDFWRQRRVFITGHSGFKGTWLSEWFVKKGVSYMGYSLPQDIGDANHLEIMLNQYEPDVIIHMAAQALVKIGYEQPCKTFTDNIMGTQKILEAARWIPVKSILVVTSDKAGTGDTDPYSASKSCASLIAQSYRASFNLPILEARAGNVIGSGDWAEGRLIPDIIRAKNAGKPVQIRNPIAIRPWFHVLDCLNAYLTLIESSWGRPVPTTHFEFGPSECKTTVKDIVDFFGVPMEVTLSDFIEREELILTPHYLGLDWSPKLTTAEALEWTRRGYTEKSFTPRVQLEEFAKL